MPTRLVRAGLLTAITDGLFSGVLAVAFYRSSVQRLFQGVASTLLGADALNGGWPTALVGMFMHVGVAFGWSAVFLLLVMRIGRVRETLASRYGVVKVAAVYGPFVWMVMSFAVIPVLLGKPLVHARRLRMPPPTRSAGQTSKPIWPSPTRKRSRPKPLAPGGIGRPEAGWLYPEPIWRR